MMLTLQAVVTLAVALAGSSVQGPPPWEKWQASAQQRVGTAAPTFSLVDLAGKRTTLEQFRGKTVVLHFGTSW